MLLARLHRPVPLYWATFLVVGLTLSLLGPALTELRGRSGTDIGGIGVLFVGQSAGYILGSFAGGRLYDRFRGHHVYAGSLLTIAMGLAAVPSLSSLSTLFVAFLLAGAGAATCDVGANALLMWELGSESSRSMNVLHLCFGIGALSAPLFVHVGLDLAVRFAALACVGLALWAVTIPPPVVRPASEDDHPDQSWRLLVLLASFFFLYVGLEIGFAGWIYTYAEEIEFSAPAATWLTTTFWVGFTAGRLASSAVGSRLRPANVLAVASVATIVASVGMVVGNGSTAVVWSMTALFGVATAPQFPVMLSYLERRIHVTGYATSWFVGAAGFGGLIFPWLIGRWFGASGASVLPWSMVILASLTAGAFVVANRTLGG